MRKDHPTRHAEVADVITGLPGNNITDNIFSKIGMVCSGDPDPNTDADSDADPDLNQT